MRTSQPNNQGGPELPASTAGAPGLVAVKIISKHKILSSGQQQHLRQELKFMGLVEHPFIVKMHGVQQDARNVYIVMDFLQHGELMQLLSAVGKMNHSCVRFYAAQVVQMIHHLHSRDLIYRDLKPENILVQDNGYLALTDFGFVKQLKPWDRTYTLCGTPEYMAPEVIMNTGHGRAADWYTLGILMFELATGKPPFMHNDPYELLRTRLKEPITFPSGLHSDLKSLIRHLTQHDLSRRFGNLIGGADDVLNHRFFKKIDWGELLRMASKPPYVPKDKTEVRAALSKERGLKLGLVPESLDNELAPEVRPAQDLFKTWF